MGIWGAPGRAVDRIDHAGQPGRPGVGCGAVPGMREIWSSTLRISTISSHIGLKQTTYKFGHLKRGEWRAEREPCNNH